MAFTVDDFQDLVRLLEQRPEWRAELRRLVLTDDLLDEGIAAGALHEDDAHDVRLADLIVRGRRPDEDRETYLVVEVSAGIGPGDVERAARRASLLGRLRAALPVVAGEWLTPDAATLVETRGVWQVLDGRVKGPGEE